MISLSRSPSLKLINTRSYVLKLLTSTASHTPPPTSPIIHPTFVPDGSGTTSVAANMVACGAKSSFFFACCSPMSTPEVAPVGALSSGNLNSFASAIRSAEDTGLPNFMLPRRRNKRFLVYTPVSMMQTVGVVLPATVRVGPRRWTRDFTKRPTWRLVRKRHSRPSFFMWKMRWRENLEEVLPEMSTTVTSKGGWRVLGGSSDYTVQTEELIRGRQRVDKGRPHT